jgi:hypothetical protein
LPIVRGEIRYGIEQLAQSRRRQALENQAATLFAIVPCEPIPETAGDHYARTKLTRQRKGLVLDENDLWIAATAHGNDNTTEHENVGHGSIGMGSPIERNINQNIRANSGPKSRRKIRNSEAPAPSQNTPAGANSYSYLSASMGSRFAAFLAG